MKTASQILERKGFENDEINDIVNNLDIQVREEFSKENEQAQMVHLWECYYKGDSAIEDENFLTRMTDKLNELAENYTK